MPIVNAKDGCPIHYQVEGPADAPVLMLCNSLGTNLHMWDDQAAEWSKHFRLVAGIAHEYRQDVMFPTSSTFESLSDPNGVVALFSHELIGRIEFHILDCTIYFNSYSGISPTHVEEVNGYLLPPQRLEYGVRWSFWN